MGLITGQFLKQIRLNSGLSTVEIARAMLKTENAVRGYEKTIDVSINKIAERARICNDIKVLYVIAKLEYLQNSRSEYLFIPEDTFSGLFLKQMRVYSGLSQHALSKKMNKARCTTFVNEQTAELSANAIRRYAKACEDIESLIVIQQLEDLQIDRNKNSKCNVNLKLGEK